MEHEKLTKAAALARRKLEKENKIKFCFKNGVCPFCEIYMDVKKIIEDRPGGGFYFKHICSSCGCERIINTDYIMDNLETFDELIFDKKLKEEV